MATKSKLIAGTAFELSQPYEAGHVVTEAEARALNQVRSENIGNNLREKVKELLEAGDAAGAQALVAEKDQSYIFSFSVGGGSIKLDPIETEARKIAKEFIKKSLAETGRKIGTPPEGTTQEDWDAKIDAEVDRISSIEDVVKLAKKNVDARKKTSDAVLAAVGEVGIV